MLWHSSRFLQRWLYWRIGDTKIRMGQDISAPAAQVQYLNEMFGDISELAGPVRRHVRLQLPRKPNIHAWSKVVDTYFMYDQQRHPRPKPPCLDHGPQYFFLLRGNREFSFIQGGHFPVSLHQQQAFVSLDLVLQIGALLSGTGHNLGALRHWWTHRNNVLHKLPNTYWSVYK